MFSAQFTPVHPGYEPDAASGTPAQIVRPDEAARCCSSDVNKIYANGTAWPLQGAADLTVAPSGEFVSLLGPSGCGQKILYCGIMAALGDVTSGPTVNSVGT